jgi:CRISPR-associated protein Csx14
VLNPGQVFACLGLVEAANVLLGEAQGTFDWSRTGDVRFRVRARGETSPVVRVLEFLDKATAVAVAPAEISSGRSSNRASWIASWGPAPRVIDRSLGYPFPDPTSPATLVCVLSDATHEIRMDHWGDATGRDNVKLWAGAGGYPGAALARDALALVAGRAVAAAADPFALAMPQSSSFRLDWRRDYIPIDAGFSLNEHSNIKAVGFPLVELLGAVGLTHARPSRPERRNKLQYVYGVVGRAADSDRFWLPPSILRVALGAVALPLPTRRFRMLLDWPGQEGQARSITTVTEETVA